MSGHEYQILRHKTAIRRRDLSLPLKCALRDEVIGSEHSVFDYGCGRGQDVDLLRAAGITCEGWDPAYYPDRPRLSADVVNLGYVINVIESPEERLSTLRDAWHLCRRLLIVSAQVTVSGRGNTQVEFGDGVVTSRGTFQKYFTQDELKAYLEKELNREAIAAGLGIFYAFKDEAAAQGFQAKRHRRREAIPRSRFTEVQFEEQREFLEPLMAAVARLGRVPEIDEFQQAEDLISRFGSLKNAFALIRRMTGEGQWRAIRERCIEDLLVYLALGRFRKRPPMSVLPIGLQRDIRAFFGSYSNACKQADELLFQAGNDEAIDVACRRSTVGKLLPDSLYVHRSALDDLAPLLRVYEGCARAYIGEITGRMSSSGIGTHAKSHTSAIPLSKRILTHRFFGASSSLSGLARFKATITRTLPTLRFCIVKRLFSILSTHSTRSSCDSAAKRRNTGSWRTPRASAHETAG